jgi:hypothetical protein
MDDSAKDANFGRAPEPVRSCFRLAAIAPRTWRDIRRALRRFLEIVLILIILFEEWGWRPLAQALAWLARFRPWARVEAAIAALPPYPALFVFALPSALLIPLKFVALFLITKGYTLTAAALFVGAKVAGTALLARLFQLTRPALMRIAWFARAYDTLMPWKTALEDYVRASWAWRWGRLVKARAKNAAARAWRRWGPQVASSAQALHAASGRVARALRTGFGLTSK